MSPPEWITGGSHRRKDCLWRAASGSMFRRCAIVAENDMRAALRLTQRHLASLREKVVAMPASVPSEHAWGA
jgi:hypothetical protein